MNISYYVPIEGERLTPIPGFEGLYSVSDLGRVIAEEAVNYANLQIRRRIKTVKTEFKTPAGYHFVILHKDGALDQFYVHRLVAQAYIDNPENKPHVNHMRGNKSDNRYFRLEWATHSENMIHGFETGLFNQTGDKNNNAVLSLEQATLIKRLSAENSTQEVLRLLGWDKSKRHLVANIKCGRLWKHINVEPFHQLPVGNTYLISFSEPEIRTDKD